MSFLQLPMDVTELILRKWLNLLDISVLDVTISHIHMRKKFLDTISSPGVIYDGNEIQKNVHASYYIWLFTRNISVSTLRFSSVFDENVLFYLQTKVCCHLKLLDFSNCPDCTVSIDSLLVNCPQLEQIYFWETSPFNVVTPTTYNILSTYCSKLKVLSLHNNRYALVDSIKVLANSCPHIIELHFYHCFNICDESLKFIAQHCIHIQKLTLRVNDLVTDTGLLAIATNCLELKSIDVTANTKITDVGVVQLSICCTKLEVLCLTSTFITDLTLVSIAKNCFYLNELILTHCNLISNDGLCLVIKQCKELKLINVTHCRSISSTLCNEMTHLTNYLTIIACTNTTTSLT